MRFGLPQMILLAMCLFSVGKDIAKHGEYKTDTVNAWSSIIAFGITFGLLYWGGFFK